MDQHGNYQQIAYELGPRQMEDYLCLLEKAQTEVIHSSSKAKVVYLNILKAATKEIMIIFPTINAFMRQELISKILKLITAECGQRMIIIMLMQETGQHFALPCQKIAKKQHSDNNMIVCQSISAYEINCEYSLSGNGSRD